MTLNILLCAYCPTVCLCRNVYLGLLSIFNWIICLFLLSCMSYFYVLEIKPLLVGTFVMFISWVSLCLWVYFGVQKLVSLIRSYLLIFVLFLLLWEADLAYWYKLCQNILCQCSLLGVPRCLVSYI